MFAAFTLASDALNWALSHIVTLPLPRKQSSTLERWKKDQLTLKQSLVLTDELSFVGIDGLRLVGGVDISFAKPISTNGPHDNLAVASLVVLKYPSLEVVHETSQAVHITEPYISGFLAFREVPLLLPLLDELRSTQPELVPQVVMVDGNGVYHPAGFGLASHFGVLGVLAHLMPPLFYFWALGISPLVRPAFADWFRPGRLCTCFVAVALLCARF